MASPLVILKGSMATEYEYQPGSIAASAQWVASTAIDVTNFKNISISGQSSTTNGITAQYQAFDASGTSLGNVAVSPPASGSNTAYNWQNGPYSLFTNSIKPAITNNSASAAVTVTNVVVRLTQN